MKKIEVKLSDNSYPVYLDSGNFDKLPVLLTENKVYKNVFVIADKGMFLKHKTAVKSIYNKFNGKKYLSIFNTSEDSKSFNSIKGFFEDMLMNGFGRDAVVIAIGGGITGDIAGFAASVFARGIQYVQVPTTLLAMVDSSVGGKTGINFAHTKNIIGTFYQPKLVLIDTDFLKTLPEEEIICGIGEVVKYGFLIDERFFELIKSKLNKLFELDTKFITRVVEECIKFKAGVVEKDEREESGLRKILNLGHTFAHAVEVEQKHKIKHGQAVIIGLGCALHLSNKIGLLSDELLARYLSLIVMFKDKIKISPPNMNKLYDIMKRDKKNKDEVIKFVLLSSAGKIIVDVEAEKQDVHYALDNGLGYFAE